MNESDGNRLAAWSIMSDIDDLERGGGFSLSGLTAADRDTIHVIADRASRAAAYMHSHGWLRDGVAVEQVAAVIRAGGAPS